jgi:hypothetical protein
MKNSLLSLARKFLAVPGLAVLALLASGAFSAAQVPYMQNFTPFSGTSGFGTTVGYVPFVGDPVYTQDVTSADSAPTGLTGITWAGSDSIGGDYYGNGATTFSSPENAYIAQAVGANGTPGLPNPPGINFPNGGNPGNDVGILTGVSGSGSWFLFDDTSPGQSVYAAQVWGTPSPSLSYSGTFSNGGVPVTPGQTYAFSFWLTNQDNSSPAILAPVINGLNLDGTGSPVGTGDGTLSGGVSANGFYSDGISGDQWQYEGPFSWTAPAGTTTAVLGLYNLQSTGAGNDFGIDNISFNAVPEPSTLVLLTAGAVGLLGVAWRRRKRTSV